MPVESKGSVLPVEKNAASKVVAVCAGGQDNSVQANRSEAGEPDENGSSFSAVECRIHYVAFSLEVNFNIYRPYVQNYLWRKLDDLNTAMATRKDVVG